MTDKEIAAISYALVDIRLAVQAIMDELKRKDLVTTEEMHAAIDKRVDKDFGKISTAYATLINQLLKTEK